MEKGHALVYPSLDSPEDEEGACDQQRLQSDCADAHADLVFADRTSFIIDFVVCWLIYDMKLLITVSDFALSEHGDT